MVPERQLSRREFLQVSSSMAIAGLPGAGTLLRPEDEIRFRKTVIDARFVAEGVAVADVNRDGHLDIVAGNIWYEAPHWTPHEIAPFQFVNPATGYSNCFNMWMDDLDHDGWPDQIVIGMPGERCYWRQNSRDPKRPWIEHPIWRSACDESPLYVDLFGDGRRVLIMGFDDEYLAWFEPDSNPFAEWKCHIVSAKKGPGSQRYCHGLGIGDINGDGMNEILTNEGYYVRTSRTTKTDWRFVPADLGQPCAHIHVLPSRHRGKLPMVLSSAAHERGVWIHEQIRKDVFVHHAIDDSISQTHSLQLAKLRRNGSWNLITGKRYFAHGPGKDPGSMEPVVLVRYEQNPHDEMHWVKHVIDADSGVGTQFVVQQLERHNKPAVVISNKKGVFLFES